MKLVIIDDKMFLNNGDKARELGMEYSRLLDAQSTAASRDVGLKDVMLGDASLLVLLDNKGKVVAGAAMQLENDRTPPRESTLMDGVRLPRYRDGSPRIGYITDLVADRNSAALMPGLQLQKQILETFKKGELGVDILTGNVVQADAATLQTAAQGLGLSTVIRTDLVNETRNGRSFFVAASADPKMPLVPSEYLNGPGGDHVLYSGELNPEVRERTHAELIEYRKPILEAKKASRQKNKEPKGKEIEGLKGPVRPREI